MDCYLAIPVISSLPSLSRFIHINCLSFSTDDLYLATSSSTETVHIFKLVEPTQEKYVQYIHHCVQFLCSSKSHTGLLLCTLPFNISYCLHIQSATENSSPQSTRRAARLDELYRKGHWQYSQLPGKLSDKQLSPGWSFILYRALMLSQ